MMSDMAKDRAARLWKKRRSLSSLSGPELRRREVQGRAKDSVSTVSYLDEPSQRDDASCLTIQRGHTYQLGQTAAAGVHPAATSGRPVWGGRQRVGSVNRSSVLKETHRGQLSSAFLILQPASSVRCSWTEPVSPWAPTSATPGASHLSQLAPSQQGPPKHFPVVTVDHILKDVLTNYLQEEEYEPELCRQMAKTISEVIKARVKDTMAPRYKLIVVVHIGQLDGQSILIGSRCLWDPKSDIFSSYVFRNSSLFALANVYGVYLE
ncbi:dynein light chain Tctex-type 5 isoform X1 [Nycticebus coucang]|uniref:dynein light chain Tctex-type 5 isoform X1 n=1 Tax=Nycticebus coucang TaxID=9470 RepID=UPI00234DEF99|nr:dynein light chain Tctex-type 5 isoform X1 [Nycticebus coucang]